MSVDHVMSAIPTMTVAKREQLRRNADAWLQQASGRAQEAKRVLKSLDDFEAGLDSVARIVEAFQRVPLRDHERLAVQVALYHPGFRSEELTEIAGWEGQSSWHLHFGKLCGNRGHLLWAAPPDAANGKPFESGILADYDVSTKGFTLKPETVEAFRRLGVVARPKP